MKSLIVVSPQKAFADALQATLHRDEWRVIHHDSPFAPGLLTVSGAVDAIVVEADLVEVGPIRTLSALEKLQPGVPILMFTGEARQEWSEEAYLAGASYILPTPIRQKLFLLLLDRATAFAGSASLAQELAPAPILREEAKHESAPTLSTLRNVSRVLTHGLASEELPKRFLELLREVLGVNRAAVFLSAPSSALEKSSAQPPEVRLHAACAIGVKNDLLEYFDLSVAGGIGRHLQKTGRILRGESLEARADREIQKEFELLGMRVAIPILDRGSLLGVAVFDDRLTGEPFTSSELALIFHAFEELGLAVKNTWLHDEVTRNHDLMTEILDELTNGCVVVSQDLQVIHCNPAARRFLLPEENKKTTKLQFADLPQVLGSRIFESLKTGVAVAAFRYRPNGPENLEDKDDLAYHISIIPFRTDPGSLSNAALMLVEDFTQIQRTQKLEVESSNLRMVRSMAEHLSHEIGNALVPMSTHQQLLDEKYDDEDFRGSLSLSLTQGIKRISRLSNQLLFLTRDDAARTERIPALKLIEDAFSDAQTLYGLNGRSLEIDNIGGQLTFEGNRPSLLHALCETLLNALQASPPDSSVKIHLQTEKEDDATWAKLRIVDKGPGFTPDLAEKAANPFFSTRTVGPGLGLTVAKKIIENHHGRLQLITGAAKGEVDIFLPVIIRGVGSTGRPPGFDTFQPGNN